MNKYDFIQQLLENKKITPAQRERVFLLTKEEFKKEGIRGKELEERVKKLEEKANAIYTKQDYSNPEIQSLEKKKKSSAPKIKHDPNIVYRLLTSFKFSEAEFNFKFLVHGYPIADFEEYNEKIAKAREDFSRLENIPISLYKELEALIYAYEIYGKKIFETTRTHPFDSDDEIKIDNDHRVKLNPLFESGTSDKPNTYKKFSTAIQNFKTEYRFDSETTESSNLKNFLENNVKYHKHNNGAQTVYSFKDDNPNSLFNDSQLEFDLKQKSFFAWNPSLKLMIKWIIESILTHSNIDGNRDFNPKNKKIRISTYEYFDEISGYEYTILEVNDLKSRVLKNPNDFTKNLWEAVSESHLISVCDFDVSFTDNDNKHFSYSVLPKGSQPEEVKEGSGGLKYRFKFIKECKA